MTTELSDDSGAVVCEDFAPAVRIQFLADPTTGYVAIQNNIPILRAIRIINNSERELANLEVSVGCSPAFAAGARFRFDLLVPGEIRKISPVDLQPDHAYLSGLNEAEKADLHVKVMCGDELLAEANHEIEVLAYDQWAGTKALPELLAAFCMPNSMVVDKLVRKASSLLRESASDLSMSGYQAKSREQVWKQVSALYSMLAAEDIHYSNPPASFGNDGQKIRTPERILEGRIATCLDTAMLFASCLEQVGLNPVVLIKQGHAWVGVWLIESSFPMALVDDVQSVRKRVQSGELIVFETTGISSAQKPSLKWACATGETHLNEEGTFLYAVDIRRSREYQIRSLPSKQAAGQEDTIEVEGAEKPVIEEMPPLPPLDPALLPATDLSNTDTPEGRVAKWKSKLLDLTLRNRLLNFKPTRTSLRVICPDPAALEDALSEGKEFKIRPLPQVMEGDDPRDGATFVARSGQQALDAMAEDALSRREIFVDAQADVIDGRMLEIFRAASTGLEEGGANTLFLVFGLLEWQEEKDSASSHLAPILLIPVTLSRQSVRGGFRLVRHDDDALVNPTLIQKLHQDFGLDLPSFDVLPKDEKGLDVGLILQTFRLHVAEIKGWEVKEQVHLGIFSFTKYLMWKDLQDRGQQLLDNPVVAHLINHPGEAFADGELLFDPRTLDQTHKPQDLFTPLLSDSSQLSAICVASEGKNLVLEGPPGTGKSQTITNLIAHLLATGKTVLFVSEKMAALEVVHRRLASLGLGPFCLELHSAKAKKSDMLKQLGMALEAAGSRTVKEWEVEAERLAALRLDLNSLTEALHRVHANDLSIYEAIGTCIKHSHWKPAAMSWTDVYIHSRADLEVLRNLSRQIGALASRLSNLTDHPFVAIKATEWSPSWQEDLLGASANLSQTALAMDEATQPLLEFFGLPGRQLSHSEFGAFDKLADVLIAAPDVPVGIARAAHDEAARSRLRVLRQHGVARQQAWDSLQGSYRENIASLNAAELELQWEQAQATWWPKKWFAKRAITSRLRLFREDKQRPDEASIPQVIQILAKLNAEDKALDAMGTDAEALLQETFAAHKTDWNAVSAHEAWAQRFSDAVMQMAGLDVELLKTLQAGLQPFVCENRAMLRAGGAVGAALVRYRDTYRKFMDALHRVYELAGCQETLVADGMAPGAGQRLLGVLQGWSVMARELQPWCLWQKGRGNAVVGGLQGIVAALEAGEISPAKVAEYFEYSYQSWWLKKSIDKEPVLCAFSSADHERKIVEFRQADERFQALTKQYIVARLAGQVPSNAALMPGGDSELGRLRRELQKQRNHMPVRQLVKGLPTLLSKLKPCLLMSPLSVAQYLDAGHAQFDVVIFDEASQIPVWDAVGAIARGRQLVCVGDPKQMPPTNFFNRVDDAEDAVAEGELQDLESILDECLSIGMPKLSLEWHYRSKHESLITFSNITYYENRLVTFPSPTTADTAVRIERVRGVYDRGGSRTNRAEAEAIVKAIEQHFLDPATQSQSLGVVTFNQTQQSLIENLLEARRRASIALDHAIARAGVEPLFIKNLENVQGDERDAIFFSVTYGPDARGKVSLNFGPLNLEGGHRRLNVAVSRARQQVVIFSTLMPEHIDLSRVRAAGVRDLKNYLDFALRGPRALVEQALPTGREPDSPFEVEVIRALREKGWEVHPQVGVGGYRVDIGVVDPRAQGRYLLGVECDGRTYHSGATARDRDRLRQHVLESLGWRLHRIWSTDWWLNPKEPLERLQTRLEELLNDEETVDLVEEQPSGGDQIAPMVDDVNSTHPIQGETATETSDSSPMREYRATTPAGGHPDAFYLMETKVELRRQLLEVINTEGPIADSALFRRIARAWNLSRTGNRIEKLLKGLVPNQVGVTKEGTVTFYWPEGMVPAEWAGFRTAGQEAGSKRPLDEICIEEIVNLARYLLSQYGETTVDDLARSVCRILGIARMTGEAETRIKVALNSDRAKAFIRFEAASVSLNRS